MRISQFFQQAADLNQSSLLLIHFHQFVAFVNAAKEKGETYQPPPPPIVHKPPIQSTMTQSIPCVVDNLLDEPLYIEKVVPDYIIQRVLESVEDAAPASASHVARSLDASVM